MRNPGLTIILLFSVSVLFFGCSHRHKVNISPEVVVSHANIAPSKTVGVKVVDLRPDKKIYSQNRFGLNDISIVASSNLKETIYDKVWEVLSLMNFRPKSFDVPTSHRFKLEILSTRLNVYGKNLKLNHEMEVALRVICTKKGSTYTKLYQVNEKDSHGIPSHITKFFSEELINAGISKALQKVFNDKNLLTFLAV